MLKSQSWLAVESLTSGYSHIAGVWPFICTVIFKVREQRAVETDVVMMMMMMMRAADGDTDDRVRAFSLFYP